MNEKINMIKKRNKIQIQQIVGFVETKTLKERGNNAGETPPFISKD